MRAPSCSADPGEIFETAVIDDPQRLYARLRAEAPLSRVGDTGVHLVATWALIEEAMSRESDFSAHLTGVLMRGPDGAPGVFELPLTDDSAFVLATADGSEHDLHRSVVQPRFAGAFVAALGEAVRGWAREEIVEWLAGGAGDFVPVSEGVPARVVGELLGLPEGDASRFRTWAMIGGDILAGNLDAARLVRLGEEAAAMAAYLGEHLDLAAKDLRREADAPLVHVLARGMEDGRIDRDQAVNIAATMFAAGGESTAALIGHAVRHLALRPDLAAALRAGREDVARFVEEVARFDPPFNFHYRVVLRRCTLGGFELHPGDRLMLLWASANRDAAQVEDPDRFRLDRKHPKKHMTFGRGSHFCIGASIARLEARIVCEELLAATESLAVEPGDAPAYANSIMAHRLERLPLRARPAPDRAPR